MLLYSQKCNFILSRFKQNQNVLQSYFNFDLILFSFSARLDKAFKETRTLVRNFNETPKLLFVHMNTHAAKSMNATHTLLATI